MSPDLLPDYPAGSAELPGCSAGCQEPAVPAALLAGCFAASRDSPTGYRAATVAPGGECSSGRTGSPPTLYCFHGRILRSLFHAPHRQACFVAHARVSKDEATSVPNRLLPHGQTQRPDPKPICRLPLKDRLNSHSPWPRNLSAHRVILAVSKTPIPRARSTARAAAVRSRNVSQFLHSVPGGGYGIVAFILQRKACSNRTTCKTNAAHFSAPFG